MGYWPVFDLEVDDVAVLDAAVRTGLDTYLFPTSSVWLSRWRYGLEPDFREFGERPGHDDLCGLGLKNFGTVDLGDARRNQRLIDSAARIAATPQRSFNTIFDWNELRGFYRLCDTPTATVNNLQHTHRQLARRAPGRAHPARHHRN